MLFHKDLAFLLPVYHYTIYQKWESFPFITIFMKIFRNCSRYCRLACLHRRSFRSITPVLCEFSKVSKFLECKTACTFILQNNFLFYQFLFLNKLASQFVPHSISMLKVWRLSALHRNTYMGCFVLFRR